MSSTLYDVVVVGAGLCGLSSAVLLKKCGLRVLVLEARAEPGGRIRSVRDFHSNECLGDLGPTWIWPQQQPAVGAWLSNLGVSVFRQFSNGSALVDLQSDAKPHLQDVQEQADAYRIDAGTSTLVSTLSISLRSDELLCGDPVSHIDCTGDVIQVYTGARTESVLAKQVIVALPPRIALRNVRFMPALEKGLADCLRQTPTWMAEHAKIVLLYQDAFWREQGLSGRVFSQSGPIGELQDHCGPAGYPAALAGFLGWNAQRRIADAASLPDEVDAQLIRLFGKAARKPLHVVIKDWAQDDLVATAADLLPNQAARLQMPELVRQAHGRGNLWFAGAETAKTGPGLIEGAFVRADEVVQDVLQTLSSRP